MKEMCRNFICDGADRPAAASSTAAEGTPNCAACVRERVGFAQAYVPTQPYEAPQEEAQSLICGTVFSDLVQPYCSGWNLTRFAKEG